MPDPIEVGVLGGGFCGLLVGHELHRRKIPFLILEKDAEPGGLAQTVKFGKIPGDTGPHALYSHNPQVMQFFRSLPVHYDVHQRKVRVVHQGDDGNIYEVNYPFENGIGDLPVRHRADCLEGYMTAARGRRRSYRNLRDWIDHALGYGIARHFMIPYNQKIWNAPLSKISMDLVKHKIDPAPLRAVIESSLGIPSVGRKVQAVFLYPRGGIGVICRHLYQKIARNVRLNESIKTIQKEGGFYIVRTSRGVYRFRKLISTIPLKEFLAKQPFIKQRKASRLLANNDTLFVSVALKKRQFFKRFADCHWLFFAGDQLFYRINMMHVFHRSSSHHLVAEITWKGEVKKWSTQRIHRRVLRDLVKTGILRRGADVDRIDSKLVTYTYPIPTVGLNPILKRLDKRFFAEKIHLLGRSGHWDYINMDQVVEKVWEFFRLHPKV